MRGLVERNLPGYVTNYIVPVLDLLFSLLSIISLCSISQFSSGMSHILFLLLLDMQLVVLLVVKTRTHFGVLLPNALLDCLKINHDMLWYMP